MAACYHNEKPGQAGGEPGLVVAATAGRPAALVISQPALGGAEQESSLHGDLHPVDQRHVGLAGGPQLLLRAPEVLGEDEEVEAEGGALQAGPV